MERVPAICDMDAKVHYQGLMDPGWRQWPAKVDGLDNFVDGVPGFAGPRVAKAPLPAAAPGSSQTLPPGYWDAKNTDVLPLLNMGHVSPANNGQRGGSFLVQPPSLLQSMPAMQGGRVPLAWPGPPQALTLHNLGFPSEEWDPGESSGGGPLPPSGSVATGNAHDEALCHREKNRKAQRKFRERQKAKLAESEAKVMELTSELDRLKMQLSAVETRNSILEKVVAMRLQDAVPGPATDVAEPASTTSDRSSLDRLTVTVKKDHPRSISIEELRAMTWKDLVALWKEYVQALATTLVDKSEGEAKQHARLTELTDEISMLFVCLNVANPKAFSNFRCLDMEKGGNVEGRQSHASMLEMVNACDFTPDQRRIICDARRDFLIKLGAIFAQRRELSQKLLDAMPALGLGDDKQPGRSDVASLFLKASEAAEHLRSNLREEQDIMSHFTVSVRSLSNSYQIATCIVRAYPFCPDALQVFNVIAQQENEPSVAELLAMGPMSESESVDF
eukprot:jgi/Botrbrau1/7002/Bobra.0165s0032.1